jgi:Flp pilus assembly protein CpaB
MLLYVPAGISDSVKVTARPDPDGDRRLRLTVAVAWEEIGEDAVPVVADVVMSNVRVLALDDVINARNAAQSLLHRIRRDHPSSVAQLNLIYLDSRAMALFRSVCAVLPLRLQGALQ